MRGMRDVYEGKRKGEDKNGNWDFAPFEFDRSTVRQFDRGWQVCFFFGWAQGRTYGTERDSGSRAGDWEFGSREESIVLGTRVVRWNQQRLGILKQKTPGVPCAAGERTQISPGR